MYKIILVLFLTLLFQSCTKEDQPQSNHQTKQSSDTSKKENDKIEKDSTIFEGLYIYNLYNNTFQDCANANQTYWVNDQTKTIESTYKKVFPLAYAYGSVYAKVRGRLTPTNDEKTKEKFSKTLVVEEVHSLERKNFRNTCVPYDFWGLGNEPGWSLQISKKENLIELNIPGSNKIYYFFYEEPKIINGEIVYSTFNIIQKHMIRISIRKEPCSDTMSDTKYEYSMKIELNNSITYKGCGIKGTF